MKKVKLAFWEFIQKQGSKDENNIEYFIDKENQEIVFKRNKSGNRWFAFPMSSNISSQPVFR